MELVHLTTNPGDLVFAPFAGPGSLAFASYILGRRFTGFVVDKDLASAIETIRLLIKDDMSKDPAACIEK